MEALSSEVKIPTVMVRSGAGELGQRRRRRMRLLRRRTGYCEFRRSGAREFRCPPEPVRKGRRLRDVVYMVRFSSVQAAR